MNRIFILGTAGAIALVVGGKIALNKQPASESALAVQSNSVLSIPSPIAVSPGQQLNPSSTPAPSPSYYSRRISTCAGAGRNANFRAHPSLDPRSILGVIRYGESVQLTGKVIQGDGVTWYEAIAPALYSSLDAGAQNRLESNQIGWIASCFIED
ncbi:MAG TPA: hypothetical protein IGS53_08015 [Leptolyngbyaceae cyanobacterium M33_DOE_097]|uniref:SH3 domain-containing protein n=1 Tax=Oscillatoriales cyanobacterium SpSt-418 TaxID=2282169 RepID=A0A7C3PFP5_9CYAN|nr:hypothetical protein [Leptolyngbyaceae cyanobacterium M33_DOE_097]